MWAISSHAAFLRTGLSSPAQASFFLICASDCVSCQGLIMDKMAIFKWTKNERFYWTIFSFLWMGYCYIHVLFHSFSELYQITLHVRENAKRTTNYKETRRCICNRSVRKSLTFPKYLVLKSSISNGQKGDKNLALNINTVKSPFYRSNSWMCLENIREFLLNKHNLM